MNAIEFVNVSKKFRKGERVDSLRDFVPNMINGLFGRNGKDELHSKEFWAVKDVSFQLKKGEALGIIGPNGAGKSTILKILSRIIKPTKGQMIINGKLSSLLEVGAGFHGDLTGRENIYLSGAIIGMKKREIDKKVDSIIEFSELEDFIDTPVKNYSSGMYVRLGFSISAHMDPDILLLDEVLAVGDINFQAKCMARMEMLVKKGVTIIFISHNLNAVELMCKMSIYLRQGQIKKYSETKESINEYKKDALFRSKNTIANNDEDIRYGTKDIEIKKVEFLDCNDVNKKIFRRGESLKIKILFDAKRPIEKPSFSVSFFTENGLLISKPNTKDHGVFLNKAIGEGEVNYLIDSLPFNIGRYLISIGCWDFTGHVAYDHHKKLYELNIEDGIINRNIHERFGLLYIPSKWRVVNDRV